MLKMDRKSKIIAAIAAVLIIITANFFITRALAQKQEYNQIVARVSKSEGYDQNRLDRYISYMKDHPEVDLNEIVTLINSDVDIMGIEYNSSIYAIIRSDGYQINLLDRYINYQKNNPDVPADVIVRLVNKNVDHSSIVLTDEVIKLADDNWFVAGRLERYLNYQKEHEAETIRKIVESVNADVDLEKYAYGANKSDGRLMLVNKYYGVDENYAPADLTAVDKAYTSANIQLSSQAYNAFIQMADAAAAAGLKLTVKANCGYRTFAYQTQAYNYYVSVYGTKKAETGAAKPGYSDYESGYGVGIAVKNNGYEGFDAKNPYRWLEEHAAEYGFILRYPDGKVDITGFNYDQTHYRYVGTEAASYIKENGITFEEYYAFFVADR